MCSKCGRQSKFTSPECGSILTEVSHNKRNRSRQSLSPWRSSYQISSLETLQKIKNVHFELPAGNVIFQKHKHMHNQSFRLPVTFSPSLKLVVIGDVVVQANHAAMDIVDPAQTQSQMIQVSSCHFFPTTDRWPNLPQNAVDGSSLLAEELNCHAHQRRSGIHKCYPWYHYSFSTDENFLLMLEGHEAPDSTLPDAWVLNAYENSTPGGIKPLFKLVAMTRIGLRTFDSSTWTDGSPLSSISCFHPFAPVIALCASGTTSLWRFDGAGQCYGIYMKFRLLANQS